MVFVWLTNDFKLTKWNDYVAVVCKPSIEEAGIGFDIENKSDGENSVRVTDRKTISYNINGDFQFNKQHFHVKRNWISNYNSFACRLLPSSFSYVLAFEFESESRMIPQNKIWRARTTIDDKVELKDYKEEQESERKMHKGKDRLFQAMNGLAKHYNIYYDKEKLKEYESVKPVVECFDNKLFEVTWFIHVDMTIIFTINFVSILATRKAKTGDSESIAKWQWSEMGIKTTNNQKQSCQNKEQF